MPVHLETTMEKGLPIATLTIENPPVNVIDLDHCHELTSCLHEIIADDRARILVIRGAGECFSAGLDIEQHTPEKMPELLPAFHEIFHNLLRVRALLIAAIHGHCLGGAALRKDLAERVMKGGCARGLCRRGL